MPGTDHEFLSLRASYMMLESELAGVYKWAEKAEKRAAYIEEQLRMVARILVPREMDDYARQHGRSPDLTALVGIMSTAGALRLCALQRLEHYPDAQTEVEWRRQVDDLQRQIQDMHYQLRAAQQAQSELETRCQSMRTALAQSQETCQTQAQRVAQLEQALAEQPRLYFAEQSETGITLDSLAVAPPRLKPLIQIMAEQGWALWTQVRDELARVLDTKPSNRSLYRLLDEAVSNGLIEVMQVPNETGHGGAVRLVQLTPTGCTLALTWLGFPPVAQHLPALLAAHKSPEHTTLNLLAAAAFEQAGYKVYLFPASLSVANGTYIPDLLVVHPTTGVTCHVECERDTRKNANERNHKWRLVSQGAGAINLVAPTDKAMSQLVSEVMSWAAYQNCQTQVRATTLAWLAEHPDQIWQVERIARGGG
ncbi:MAG: hypothetical protein KKA73_05965 [Chloroflexi bacterium]|nr:hypothetical protein [Chloroflexota bacterium]MBU1747215.1 hypothetical protein [Chloroflexota bacterium]